MHKSGVRHQKDGGVALDNHILLYKENTMESDTLKREIEAILPEIENELIQIRRQLHQFPELGFAEHRTMAFVAEHLQALGLSPKVKIGGTGVLADLLPSGAPAVGFRVDMDALPVEEKTGAPYASRNPGVMHACGHDVHTTLGIGVAKVMTRLGEALPGSVRLLFQPAEELMPGGAVEMIRGGALEGLEALYGVHADPSIPVGKIGLKYGAQLASVDTFEIEIIGKGGHAAHPQLAVDPIQVAAQVITALHAIPSRKVDPVQPVVISVTTVHAGRAANVIPDTVRLTGTYRTLDAGLRSQLPSLMEDTVAGITSAFGASFRLSVDEGAPVLVNDEPCMQILEEAGNCMLSRENTIVITVPRMGSEDFANYLEHVPGAMLRLGTCGGERTAHSLHSPYFDVDEHAIAVGVKVLSFALVRYLQQRPHRATP